MTTSYTPDLPTLRAALIDAATELKTQRTALRDRLIPSADPAVASRAADVAISLFRVTSLNGAVDSFHGTTLTGWETRISFIPKVGHHCTCPDWKNRQRACKHVVALAERAIQHLVLKENRATQVIETMDEKVRLLQIEAHEALRLLRS